MAGARLEKYYNAAKKMVAKGKTYGKKKGRDLASVFFDLSISPSKPGVNAIVRVLAPTPDSQDEPLLESNTAPGKEQAAETVDQDEDKEKKPRKTTRRGKRVEEGLVEAQESSEISELTRLEFVGSEVVDFQNFCKGWSKKVKLTKIGQGSFATVLRMELKSQPGQYSIWKLMPLKPSKGSGSRPIDNQTLIKDAATEVKMLFTMSDIDGFVQFRSAHVVKGSLPDQIEKAQVKWLKGLDRNDTSNETSMSSGSKDQVWLLMEMTDAGQDIDSMISTARSEQKLYSVHETTDIFWGIAEALMRGEAQTKFEHRDLHVGNVCVKKRPEPLHLTTEHGVPRVSTYEVTLIDYTQSRLTLGSGEVLATAIDESIFRQIDDDPDAQKQYDVYRAMRDIVKKEKKQGVKISQMWKEYVPVTNVLWLHHILGELMTVTRKISINQEESDLRLALVSLGLNLSSKPAEQWRQRSARDVVCSFLVDR